MTSWLDNYLFAIDERDKKEKVDRDLYARYTRLADRVAKPDSLTIESHHTKLERSPGLIPGKIVDGAKEQDQNLVSESVALSKLRGNLSEAQHSRSMMQLRLQSLTEENKTLRGQSAFDSKQISELTSERIHLATKVKDRDEELKGKARLLENIHDETVSLILQLNMAEALSRKLEQENKELVDRWMARMGEEADAMNKASNFS